MNIFYLDRDPEQCAKWHVDRHIVKMPLEYAQLLSTAHVMIDGVQRGYKATHQNHPSAKWARSSLPNYHWLYKLFQQTAEEYRYRYGRPHKSWTDLSEPLRHPPRDVADLGWFPPFMAMPVDYMVIGKPMESYRDYYNRGKRDLHCWSRRDPPPWITIRA